MSKHFKAGWGHGARGLIAAALLGTMALPGMAQETPLPGGTLHLAAPYGAALKSLDPHMTWRSQDMAVSKAFHRSLYNWDTEQNKPVLELATSVDVGPDGRSYTYHLRQDAYFHNGRLMNADDVIWSLTRLADPKRAFPGASIVANIEGADDYVAGKAKTISGLRKIDEHTVEIRLKNFRDPGMLFFEAVTSILPPELADTPEFLTHPVGLGPFRFVEHVAGSRIVGERFDKYYKPGLPYADRVEFTITNDYSALDMAFRSGELDATVISGSAYGLYKQDPKLSAGLIEVPELFTRHMGMNLQMKPFDDLRVRQAINMAVDRDLIIRKLLKNKAFKAVGWLPSSSTAFDDTRAPYPYDPARAKELMKEAGYGDGTEIEIWATDGTDGIGVVQAMMPFLDKIGIKVKPKVVESNVLLDAINAGQAQAWIRSAGTGPDPIGALRCYDSRVSRPSCNRSGFNDPKFDALLDEAAAQSDPAKRRALTMQADGYIFDQAPVWFHNYNKAVVATQPWIHGVGGNVTEAAILEVDRMWLDASDPNRDN